MHTKSILGITYKEVCMFVSLDKLNWNCWSDYEKSFPNGNYIILEGHKLDLKRSRRINLNHKANKDAGKS